VILVLFVVVTLHPVCYLYTFTHVGYYVYVGLRWLRLDYVTLDVTVVTLRVTRWLHVPVRVCCYGCYVTRLRTRLHTTLRYVVTVDFVYVGGWTFTFGWLHVCLVTLRFICVYVSRIYVYVYTFVHGLRLHVYRLRCGCVHTHAVPLHVRLHLRLRLPVTPYVPTHTLRYVPVYYVGLFGCCDSPIVPRSTVVLRLVARLHTRLFHRLILRLHTRLHLRLLPVTFTRSFTTRCGYVYPHLRYVYGFWLITFTPHSRFHTFAVTTFGWFALRLRSIYVTFTVWLRLRCLPTLDYVLRRCYHVWFTTFVYVVDLRCWFDLHGLRYVDFTVTHTLHTRVVRCRLRLIRILPHVPTFTTFGLFTLRLVPTLLRSPRSRLVDLPFVTFTTRWDVDFTLRYVDYVWLRLLHDFTFVTLLRYLHTLLFTLRFYDLVDLFTLRLFTILRCLDVDLLRSHVAFTLHVVHGCRLRYVWFHTHTLRLDVDSPLRLLRLDVYTFTGYGYWLVVTVTRLRCPLLVYRFRLRFGLRYVTFVRYGYGAGYVTCVPVYGCLRLFRLRLFGLPTHTRLHTPRYVYGCPTRLRLHHYTRWVYGSRLRLVTRYDHGWFTGYFPRFTHCCPVTFTVTVGFTLPHARLRLHGCGCGLHFYDLLVTFARLVYFGLHTRFTVYTATHVPVAFTVHHIYTFGCYGYTVTHTVYAHGLRFTVHTTFAILRFAVTFTTHHRTLRSHAVVGLHYALPHAVTFLVHCSCYHTHFYRTHTHGWFYGWFTFVLTTADTHHVWVGSFFTRVTTVHTVTVYGYVLRYTRLHTTHTFGLHTRCYTHTHGLRCVYVYALHGCYTPRWFCYAFTTHYVLVTVTFGWLLRLDIWLDTPTTHVYTFVHGYFTCGYVWDYGLHTPRLRFTRLRRLFTFTGSGCSSPHGYTPLRLRTFTHGLPRLRLRLLHTHGSPPRLLRLRLRLHTFTVTVGLVATHTFTHYGSLHTRFTGYVHLRLGWLWLRGYGYVTHTLPHGLVHTHTRLRVGYHITLHTYLYTRFLLRLLLRVGSVTAFGCGYHTGLVGSHTLHTFTLRCGLLHTVYGLRFGYTHGLFYTVYGLVTVYTHFTFTRTVTLYTRLVVTFVRLRCTVAVYRLRWLHTVTLRFGYRYARSFAFGYGYTLHFGFCLFTVVRTFCSVYHLHTHTTVYFTHWLHTGSVGYTVPVTRFTHRFYVYHAFTLHYVYTHGYGYTFVYVYGYVYTFTFAGLHRFVYRLRWFYVRLVVTLPVHTPRYGWTHGLLRSRLVRLVPYTFTVHIRCYRLRSVYTVAFYGYAPRLHTVGSVTLHTFGLVGSHTVLRFGLHTVTSHVPHGYGSRLLRLRLRYVAVTFGYVYTHGCYGLHLHTHVYGCWLVTFTVTRLDYLHAHTVGITRLILRFTVYVYIHHIYVWTDSTFYVYDLLFTGLRLRLVVAVAGYVYVYTFTVVWLFTHICCLRLPVGYTTHVYTLVTTRSRFFGWLHATHTGFYTPRLDHTRYGYTFTFTVCTRWLRLGYCYGCLRLLFYGSRGYSLRYTRILHYHTHYGLRLHTVHFTQFTPLQLRLPVWLLHTRCHVYVCYGYGCLRLVTHTRLRLRLRICLLVGLRYVYVGWLLRFCTRSTFCYTRLVGWLQFPPVGPFTRLLHHILVYILRLLFTPHTPRLPHTVHVHGYVYSAHRLFTGCSLRLYVYGCHVCGCWLLVTVTVCRFWFTHVYILRSVVVVVGYVTFTVTHGWFVTFPHFTVATFRLIYAFTFTFTHTFGLRLVGYVYTHTPRFTRLLVTHTRLHTGCTVWLFCVAFGYVGLHFGCTFTFVTHTPVGYVTVVYGLHLRSRFTTFTWLRWLLVAGWTTFTVTFTHTRLVPVCYVYRLVYRTRLHTFPVYIYALRFVTHAVPHILVVDSVATRFTLLHVTHLPTFYHTLRLRFTLRLRTRVYYTRVPTRSLRFRFTDWIRLRLGFTTTRWVTLHTVTVTHTTRLPVILRTFYCHTVRTTRGWLYTFTFVTFRSRLHGSRLHHTFTFTVTARFTFTRLLRLPHGYGYTFGSFTQVGLHTAGYGCGHSCVGLGLRLHPVGSVVTTLVGLRVGYGLVYVGWLHVYGLRSTRLCSYTPGSHVLVRCPFRLPVRWLRLLPFTRGSFTVTTVPPFTLYGSTFWILPVGLRLLYTFTFGYVWIYTVYIYTVADSFTFTSFTHVGLLVTHGLPRVYVGLPRYYYTPQDTHAFTVARFTVYTHVYARTFTGWFTRLVTVTTRHTFTRLLRIHTLYGSAARLRYIYTPRLHVVCWLRFTHRLHFGLRLRDYGYFTDTFTFTVYVCHVTVYGYGLRWFTLRCSAFGSHFAVTHVTAVTTFAVVTLRGWFRWLRFGYV